MGVRYHYEKSDRGEKELTGMTFIVRAGLWAKYFLNEEGKKTKSAYYQAGLLPKKLLEAVMSVWQHWEGAARLIVWLLFKAQFNRHYPLSVETLMEVAYGLEKIEQAKHSSELRKKLVSNWDEDLLVLHERGWKLQFDPETYPIELQPSSFGRIALQRPRGYFEKLLSARLWITPSDTLIEEAPLIEASPESTVIQSVQNDSELGLTGSQLKAMRITKGWSQRKLASLSGLSQPLIALIEKNERIITPENEEILKRTFETN